MPRSDYLLQPGLLRWNNSSKASPSSRSSMTEGTKKKKKILLPPPQDYMTTDHRSPTALQYLREEQTVYSRSSTGLHTHSPSSMKKSRKI